MVYFTESSLIKTLKKRGPRAHLCGTPDNTYKRKKKIFLR
jgi:hypothetical protein